MSKKESYNLGPLYPFSSPLFFRKTSARASEVGAVQALSETFRNANIDIQIDGDVQRWANPRQAVLMVGDHTNRLDDLILNLAFEKIGRRDLYTLGRPYSPLNHLFPRLGEPETDHMIPVLPRNMAKGRQDNSLKEKIIKYIFRHELPDEKQIQEFNRTALQTSAELLREGAAVNICPAGHKKDDGSLPWYRGVGEIIKLVAPEDRGKVMVVQYRVEDINQKNILLANLVKYPRKQVIILNVGPQGTIDELFRSDQSVDNLSSLEVTRILEASFKDYFYPQKPSN